MDHNDTRICDSCRKLKPKSELISNCRGQWCRKCHKKIFGEYDILNNRIRSKKYDE